MPPETGRQPKSGQLVANLVLFGRLLRAVGLEAPPSAIRELLRALDLTGIRSRREVYYAARALLVTRPDQRGRFDRAFELFWRAALGQLPKPAGRPRPADRPASPVELAVNPAAGRRSDRLVPAPAAEPAEGEPAASPAARTYSPVEVLRRKDFGQLSADELEQVKRLMAELVLDLGSRRSRRWVPSGGPPPDLRRSLRRGLRSGGELLELLGREPKWKPRPLVVIADISGSMERYSGLLLRFIYSIARTHTRPIESFVFSTQLTRITPHLAARDVEQALGEITRHVPDWSGGTRIGQSLKAFSLGWARRVLSRGAIVLLISDGWDRGDIDLLRREIARLQRSCHRLVWLNPLMGSPYFEPLTMGLRAARPYVDDFLPIHNLESLEQLAQELARLSPVRPVRRRIPN